MVGNRLRFRKWHKFIADTFGYFWLPCPVCGEFFSGREYKDGWYPAKNGRCVCPKQECMDVARRAYCVEYRVAFRKPKEEVWTQ